MKIKSFKNFLAFSDNNKRLNFSKNEIFLNTFFILKQSKITNKLMYFEFKCRFNSPFFTRLQNRCLLSGYSRSVSSNIKLSRFALSRNILNGSLVGFYRSV